MSENRISKALIGIKTGIEFAIYLILAVIFLYFAARNREDDSYNPGKQ